MTGIAGLVAPEKADAMSRLQTALGAMENRGSITKTTIVNGKEGQAAIGICSHQHEESIASRPEDTSIVLDGVIPPSLKLDEIGGQSDEESLSEAIEASCPFSTLVISAGRLLAARDLLGQKPLYYGSSQDGVVAFASLKTALIRIGVSAPVAVPPGRVLAGSGGRSSVIVDKPLARPRPIRVSEDEASTKIRALLIDSLSQETHQDLALAFSGGLDSTLVAQAAKENDLRPELITVGVKGQPELRHASEIARRVGLDLTRREISVSEVIEALPRVVRTIESSDPTLVGVSVPLFFVCELAQEMGMDCLLAGQLSDELFAGYGRFDELARKGNDRAAREEVWRSVLAAAANDFETGDKLAVSHRLELRCPFASVPLVEYALRVPMSLKLRIEGGKVVRKYILRCVAAEWKLPVAVVDRPKKAVQYSTGVQKILLKEAKKRGLTLSSLLRTFL